MGICLWPNHASFQLCLEGVGQYCASHTGYNRRTNIFFSSEFVYPRILTQPFTLAILEREGLEYQQRVGPLFSGSWSGPH